MALETPTLAPSVPSGAPSTPAPTPHAPCRPRQSSRVLQRVCSLIFTGIPLALLAAGLLVGMVVEVFYGHHLARELVYQTWWLTLLLSLLAIRVLAAVAVRLPPRRKQAGFLIAAAGVLLFLGGTLLDRFLGAEGRLVLADSADPEIRQSYHLSQQAEAVSLTDRHQLELFRVPAEPTPDDPAVEVMSQALENDAEVSAENRPVLDGFHWTVPLTPGSLAWHDDEDQRTELPRPLRWLQALASPGPNPTRDLGEGASLKIDNFYPHTEQWPYRKAKDDEVSFAALRLRLTTDSTSRPRELWLTSQPGRPGDPGPLALELMELDEPALLPEFTHPPDPATLGKQGQLVLALGRRGLICRLAVDALKPGVPVELSGTPLLLTLKRTGDLMDLLKYKDRTPPEPKGPAAYPAVHFELTGPHGKGEYLACARLPQMPAHLRGDNVIRVATWYHVPDLRFGDSSKEAALHFLHGPEGKVYHRVVARDGTPLEAHEIDVTDLKSTFSASWGVKETTFQATAWLPRAARGPGTAPVCVELGAEPPDGCEPGLRCTLTVGDRSEEFRVRLSTRPVRVQVGDALFFARYRPVARPTGCALTLKEARSPTAADLVEGECDVSLAARGDGKQNVADHTIAPGQALACGPFTVSRARCRPLVDPRTEEPVIDSRGRRVHVASLTAIHDPGLVFKYGGVLLLGLGGAMMVWMGRMRELVPATSLVAA